jgi:predicted Zn-dependent protease
MNCKHYLCLLYGFIFTLMPLYSAENSQIASMAPSAPAQNQVAQQQELAEHLMKTEDFYSSYTGFLSEEKEKEIRDILVEIGAQDVDSIRIKGLTNSLLETLGVMNACAIYIPIIERAIYVSASFFEVLSPAERKFLIAHEWMHIKHKHQLKRIGLIFLIHTISSIASTVSLRLLDPRISANPLASFGLTYLLNAVGLIAIYYPFCRQQELQADSKAAKVLGSINGGMGLFHIFRKNEIAVKKDLGRIGIFGPMILFFKKIMQPFASHPQTEKRIQELKKLENNREKSSIQSATLASSNNI